jgi:DNA-binding transcriptional MerR regulator
MTSVEVCEAARITYRQLDWWVRRGFVKCSQVTSNLTGNSGSGWPQ